MRPLDYYLDILPKDQQTQEVKDLIAEILEDAEAEWDSGYSQGHDEGYSDGNTDGYKEGQAAALLDQKDS